MDRQVAQIDAMNDLIRVAEDSHLALQQAATDLHQPDWKAICADLSERRAQLIRDLQAQVAALGGAPDATGTLIGGARRMVAELGVVLGARDADDILDSLVHQQETVLEQLDQTRRKDLPAEVTSALGPLAARLRDDRDRLAAARDAARAAESANGKANA